MPVSRLLRRTIAALGAAALLLLLLAGCRLLAARITAAHMLHEAQRQYADLQAGRSPWPWTLSQPSDLVAGRPFGHAEMTQIDGGLRFRSLDGSPFELGLPVERAIDLAHWPLLNLQVDPSAAGTLTLIRQATPTSIACLAEAGPLPPGRTSLQFDLRRLHWQSATGGSCAPLAQSWMLRLRLQLPADGNTWLGRVALFSPAPISMPMAPDLTLHSSTDIDDAGQAIDALPAPWIALPAGASAETLLALRDRLRVRWPAALIVPAGGDPRQELAGTPLGSQVWQWAACLTYLCLLAGLALAHPRRTALFAWVEVLASLTGPLWLVAGLQWAPRPALPAVVAALGALGYAVRLAWQRPLPGWWKLGSTRDWLLAMLPAALAMALLLGWGRQRHMPLAGHLLAYLAWASLQQWLMLVVVQPRLKQSFGHLADPWRTGLALLATATAFALLHTPNGAAMQLCLLAELGWAGCFLRSPRLPPIIAAHAACGLLLESGLFGVLLRSLEVSARFFL